MEYEARIGLLEAEIIGLKARITELESKTKQAGKPVLDGAAQYVKDYYAQSQKPKDGKK